MGGDVIEIPLEKVLLKLEKKKKKKNEIKDTSVEDIITFMSNWLTNSSYAVYNNR